MAARQDLDGDRIAVVGASYSGEAIGEALRAGGETATAYVLLSPGSFSQESIAAVDASGASWLFIRTSDEDEVSLPYIDAVFEDLAAGSRSAEVRVVAAAGHATGILEAHPFVIDEIADWLAARLGGADPRAGDLAARYEEAVGAYAEQDYATALPALQALADRDHPGVWFHLGLIHQHGQGVAVDPAEAARWYLMAAERGHSSAQLSLALLHHTGQGVPRDYATAAQWCRRAAESDLVGAQVTLALMYQEGQGVKQDHAQAAGWFRKAAEQGHPGAQLSLATLYLQGQGVTADDVEAADWCRRAAEQGEAAAQFMLAFMYQQGRGVPEDQLSAHAWASRAVANSDDPAAIEFLQALEASMTPEEISEARRRAGERKRE
jgi:TPR repeat protein